MSGALLLRDQTVRVGGIADHEHLDVRRRVIVERVALRLEDPAVRLQQVTPLHPLGPRSRADQQRDADAVEAPCSGHL